MNLKIMLRAGLAALTLALLPAVQAHAQTQGRDFALVEPAVPTESPGKIEVLEFFSYGCPHCADLHPVVKAWSAKKPADVELRRMPVTFGNLYYTNLSRLYHALDAIGELKRLDDAVFAALHQNGFARRDLVAQHIDAVARGQQHQARIRVRALQWSSPLSGSSPVPCQGPARPAGGRCHF